jgi:hypothetical protein
VIGEAGATLHTIMNAGKRSIAVCLSIIFLTFPLVSFAQSTIPSTFKILTLLEQILKSLQSDFVMVHSWQESQTAAVNASIAQQVPSFPTSRVQFITDLYQCILDRQPDSSGLVAWVNASYTKTLPSIYESWFSSPEYFGNNISNAQFVTQLYNCILFRQPDQKGYNGYFQALSGGSRTRAGEVETFVTGNEFTTNQEPKIKSVISKTNTTTIGYIRKVTPGDGVAQGWAFDKTAPASSTQVNFYLNNTASKGGILIGSVFTKTVDNQINWDYNISGDHGFTFSIPNNLRDGLSHKLFVQPVDAEGNVGKPINSANGISFKIGTNTLVGTTPVTDTSCLSPDSRCPSVGSDYLAPNYPSTSGWSDGQNYFSKWQCVSPSGFNYIARLNIIPLGTSGPTFQKDSLDTNWYYDQSNGNPILYFNTSDFSFNATWSIKKAIYDPAIGKWNIYSVFDNPTVRGGVSSPDGRAPYLVMNDYGQPGWGPISPVSGSQNKIPGVSDVSASQQIPSYPLIGSGPLGITAITHAVWPSTISGGPEGRTCIIMNPKLLDYDANGVPHTLIGNMWQNTTSQACPLPLGAPIGRLPTAGNYLFRYQGPTLGWQLDLTIGKITDSLHSDPTNILKQTPKLMAGTAHTLVLGNWDGTIEMIDMDKPKTSDATMMLDCSASGIHFGEATGRLQGVLFQSVPADIVGGRTKYRLSTSVLPVDIYYAFTVGTTTEK